jgi:hypothetical protein
MFKMIKTDDNELTEDLIVTGHPSRLVDQRSEEEEKRTPKWANHKIDDKYTTEKELLTILIKCLKQFYQKYPVLNGYMLFDYITPFLIKRLIVNGFSLNDLPSHLIDYTKKPWEKINFCLHDFWKFGSYNKSATMYILCKLFDIEFDIHNINSETFLKSYFSLIEKIFKKNTI